MIYHIIQEGPGTGMVAACTSDPNGERNREPEERCNIPHAPHFTTLRKAHKYLRDTVGREPSPMELEGSILVDEDERSRNNSARRATNPTYFGQNGNTLHTIAHSARADTRMHVAMCYKTMAHTIHALASDPDPLVRAINAENATQPRALAIAARDTEPDVAVAAATNTHTAGSDLAYLAAHGDERVRRMVALNKSTPEETALALTYDEDNMARAGAGAHKNTPVWRKKELAQSDTEPIVLNFLINSTDTPLCVIRIMSERGNQRARNYLAPDGELDARRQRAALARFKRTARPWFTMTGWGNL